VTINAGRINFNHSSAFGTGSLTINGGRLDPAASGAGQNVTTANNNVWNANWTMGRGTTGNGTWNNNGDILLGANVTVSSANNFTHLHLGGVISDGGNGYSLTLDPNTVSLLNANTFSGGLTFGGGISLNINHPQALGTGPLTISGNRTINNTSVSPVTLSNTNNVTLGGNLTFTGSNDLNMGPGSVTLTGNRTVTVDAGTLTFGGSVLPDATVSRQLTKAGSGTLRLAGTNGTYAGATVISAGTLEVAKLADGGANSSIGAADNTAARLVINNDGTLRYIGAGDSTDRLFRFGTAGAGAITLDSSGSGLVHFTNTGSPTFNGDHARTLNLIGSNTGTNTLAALLPLAGSTLSVLKDGVGTWVLTGANTYTGPTTLNAGTLLVNGSIAAGSTFNFVGGTLGGSGMIGGSVTVPEDGNLTLGSVEPGTLTIGGDLDISAISGEAGKLFFKLDEVGSSDKIVVGGTLTIDSLGFDDFDFTALVGFGAGTYTLIESGDISGELDDTPFALTGSIGLMNGTLQTNGDDIVLVVIPSTDAPPTISSTDPANNATGVAIDAALVATFDKDIELMDGGLITITNLTAATAQTITLPNGQITVENDRDLTINLAADFTIDNTYAVLIDGDAIKDKDDKNFAGFSDTTLWRFSILGAPTVDASMGAIAEPVSATLRGQVVADGGDALTTVRIYFGTTDGESDTGEWDVAFDFDLSDITLGETFTTNIIGLLYGQEYYYRVFAENAYAGRWSDTVGPFTTEAPEWTPLAILDEVEFWLDAADADSLDLDGSSVMQWNDKSGNERHVSQTTPGNRPTYGSSAVTFQNSSSTILTNHTPFVSAIMAADGNLDFFIVAKMPSQSDRRIIAEGNSSSQTPIYSLAQTRNNNNGQMGGFIRNDGNTAYVSHEELSGNDAFNNTLRLYHWRDTGSQVSGRLNGGSAMSETYTREGILTVNRFAIGGLQRAATASEIDGDIHEILITRAQLDEDDRQTIEGYLAYKWGIEDSLPEGHSFTASSVDVTATLATNITATTAEIQGVLNATQSVFTVMAYWSRTDHQTDAAWLAGYDGSAVVGSFTNVVDHAFDVPIGGLSRGATYYFTFRASNSAGEIWAPANGTFETLGPTIFRFR